MSAQNKNHQKILLQGWKAGLLGCVLWRHISRRDNKQPHCPHRLTCVLVGRFLSIPESAVTVTESSVSAPVELQKKPYGSVGCAASQIPQVGTSWRQRSGCGRWGGRWLWTLERLFTSDYHESWHGRLKVVMPNTEFYCLGVGNYNHYLFYGSIIFLNSKIWF